MRIITAVILSAFIISLSSSLLFSREMNGGKVRFSGRVVSVNRIDIDKSGKNPSMLIYIRLSVVSVAMYDTNGYPQEGTELTVKVRERMVRDSAGRDPITGDVISVYGEIVSGTQKDIRVIALILHGNNREEPKPRKQISVW
jgi:hypothetical protein